MNIFRQDSSEKIYSKDDYKYNRNRRNFFSDYKRDEEIRVREEKKIEENRKATILKEALDPNNFPDFANNIVSNEKKNIDKDSENIISFLDKLKVEISVDTEKNKDKKELPLGWVEIVSDKKTNKPYIKNNKRNNDVLEERDIINVKINKLIDKFEKRKKEQIDLWGEDEYDKLFIFPNYEYFYFDRLDREYEEELERQREREEEEYNMYNNEEEYYEYNEYYK